MIVARTGVLEWSGGRRAEVGLGTAGSGVSVMTGGGRLLRRCVHAVVDLTVYRVPIHSHWKSGKKWKSGIMFSSQAKIREFEKNREKSGNLINLTTFLNRTIYKIKIKSAFTFHSILFFKMIVYFRSNSQLPGYGSIFAIALNKNVIAAVYILSGINTCPVTHLKQVIF